VLSKEDYFYDKKEHSIKFELKGSNYELSFKWFTDSDITLEQKKKLWKEES